MGKSLKLEFAGVLIEARKGAGLSQKAVSEAMGYSTPQFVSNWERGMSMPPVDQLKQLAKMYKADANQLIELYIGVHLENEKSKLLSQFNSSKK